MANSTSGNVITIDTAGVILSTPIRVGKIVFMPHAAGDVARIDSYNDSVITVEKDTITYTITTSTDDTITSTGNFASTWAAGYVVKCVRTSGSDAGVLGIIKTAGNNNAIVILLSPFTTEANKVGDFVAYTNRREFYLEGGLHNASLQPIVYDFTGFAGGGKLLPNLIVPTLSSEATLAIYPA